MKFPAIILTMSFSEENGVWYGKCEELGTSTFGDSFEEVKKEIAELITLHLNTLEKLGEREKFFKENGIKVYEHHIPDDIQVTVPVKPNTFINTQVKEVAFA